MSDLSKMTSIDTKRDAFGKPIDDDETYVVQDTRCIVGNCVLWWAKDHCGYVCELDKAHVFTGYEVTRRVDNLGPHASGSTFVAWPWTLANKHVVKHVRMEPLRRAAEEARRNCGACGLAHVSGECRP